MRWAGKTGVQMDMCRLMRAEMTQGVRYSKQGYRLNVNENHLHDYMAMSVRPRGDL